MFTGIVECVARVVRREAVTSGVRLTIEAPAWDPMPASGDSIAIDGCCLTLVTAGPEGVQFDVVPQTLSLTTIGGLTAGDRVNLERAITPSTPLGGHIVQGHIDGLAEVVDVTAGDEEHRLRVRPPSDLMHYLPERGSVALAGVSLTVATAADDSFEVALIPTTLERTTLVDAVVGTRLNVEADYLAKVVVNHLRRSR